MERPLEEHFCELAGERVRSAVHTYSALTLARHVFLSTRFSERRALTEPLLAVCEERVGSLGI